ncbi:MAG: CPBP family intramembrane glutamic endopeptidase [Acidimicrobiales bacterium]
MTAARPALGVAAMAAALGVFVARPLLPGGTVGLVVLFGVLLALGAAWPVDGEPRPATRAAISALALGVLAFALGRLLGGDHSLFPSRAGYVAAIAFAAVAEELFFRRFVYAVLRPGGAALAVGGTSVLFAAAHVTVYGWWVLPVDLAAGLVLGWQRWASGTWTVPAVTHVVANVLVVL